ncbi:hypothetical protein B0O99DRAFT_698889 [Bisporella sp. PMI_857]|nr:hypothetical protein B0O99DRAFT_698889 [Bisporella sp. PMI_857]
MQGALFLLGRNIPRRIGWGLNPISVGSSRYIVFNLSGRRPSLHDNAMNSSHIYTGPWVYQSRGKILGATITLSTIQAGFLLSGITFLVGLAGNAAWGILKYIFHQLSSSRDPRHAIFRQLQAILKNSGTATNSAWKFLIQTWAWRENKRIRNWRPCIFGLLSAAVFISIGFSVASILCSRFLGSGIDYFLIHSAGCGAWLFDTSNAETPRNVSTQWQSKMLSDASNAATYARTCYNTTNLGGSQCQAFPVSQIEWSINLNASCPFKNGTCAFSDTAAYQMDTGYLDSHDVLGINAIPGERIAVRKVATCAPIRAKPYMKDANVTLGSPGEEMITPFILFEMGPLLNQTATTFEYNLLSRYCQIGPDLQTVTDMGGSVIWSPISDLQRSDGQVSLFLFSQNSVKYAHPNDDYIFQANKPILQDGEVVFYDYNYFVAIFGCVDQYQLCNPAKPGPVKGEMACSPLSTRATLANFTGLGLNSYQLETARPVFTAMLQSDMHNAVWGRRGSALTSQSTVRDLLQLAPLPDNQWQIELAGWFGASLARFQQSLLEYALGPVGIVENGGSVISPTSNDTVGRAICNRQMIRNASGYQNFSTLALVIVLLVSSVLISLDLTLDVGIGFVQKKMGKEAKYRRLCWVEDGYLQVQRMAYEGAGYDDWEECAENVPVLKENNRGSQVLGGLDDEDPNHPKLIREMGMQHGQTVQEAAGNKEVR